MHVLILEVENIIHFLRKKYIQLFRNFTLPVQSTKEAGNRYCSVIIHLRIG